MRSELHLKINLQLQKIVITIIQTGAHARMGSALSPPGKRRVVMCPMCLRSSTIGASVLLA